MAAVSEGEPLSSSPGAGADSPTKITGWGGGHGGGGRKRRKEEDLFRLGKVISQPGHRWFYSHELSH